MITTLQTLGPDRAATPGGALPLTAVNLDALTAKQLVGTLT